MKAAIVERPGIVTVKDIPVPTLGKYDMLCRILYGATCSGTDLHLIHGTFPWKVDYPTVLGHESIGRVVELGESVRNFCVGDLITRVGTPPTESGCSVSWGGFAEFGIARDYRAMRADGRPETDWGPYKINQPLPSHFDPASATMIVTWRETYSYAFRMGIGPDATVLVSGSGGNGLALANHARNLGAAAIVMIGNAARSREAAAVGAIRYFDYREERLADLVREAFPAGFDFVIDAVGRKDQADTLLPLVKIGGTFGVYGIDDYYEYMLPLSRFRGTFTFYCGGYDEAEAHDPVVDYIDKGLLRADVWFDSKRPYPLERIGEAYQAVRDKRTVKAVVQLAADVPPAANASNVAEASTPPEQRA